MGTGRWTPQTILEEMKDLMGARRPPARRLQGAAGEWGGWGIATAPRPTAAPTPPAPAPRPAATPRPPESRPQAAACGGWGRGHACIRTPQAVYHPAAAGSTRCCRAWTAGLAASSFRRDSGGRGCPIGVSADEHCRKCSCWPRGGCGRLGRGSCNTPAASPANGTWRPWGSRSRRLRGLRPAGAEIVSPGADRSGRLRSASWAITACCSTWVTL